MTMKYGKFTLAFVSFFAAVSLIMPAGYAKDPKAEFEPIEEKKLASGKQMLSKDHGYILTHYNSRSAGIFIKEPSEEQIAAYDQKWIEKLAKAKKKYPSKLARWKQLQELKSSRKKEKPIEPTEENFAIEPIELWNIVNYGPQFIFNKDKSDKENPIFRYLTQVEPGNYVYYGPLTYLPGAAPFGECYCMGTIRIEVKAGEITNLGNFLTVGHAIDNGGSDLSGSRLLLKNSPDSKLARWLKNPVDYTVPSSLSALPATQPEIQPFGKVNNFLRAMVSRMGPVEGLFSYERDKMIDLRKKVTVGDPCYKNSSGRCAR